MSIGFVAAALAGLVIRLFLVLRYPAFTDDSAIYEELAHNWLQAHVYGLFYVNGLVPSDIRVPGYPAFLVLVYKTIGRSEKAIVLAQAALDFCTCFITARLATVLAPEENRRRVALAALWLAATCPFIANYAAVPLTEVLAAFLTGAALLAYTWGLVASKSAVSSERPRSDWKPWLAGGFLTGLAALVRPESPLLLVAVVAVLAIRWRRRSDWGKLIRAGALAATGMILPLLPWAARNALRFHEVQFLSPRYAATPGDYVPRGLYAWTATWLVRFRDVYLVPWNIGSVPVALSDIPPSAFDSAQERARAAELLREYDATLKMTPQIDARFAELARERTARHPFRTYLFVPLGRAATMWFTPRVDLLPFSGHLWPLRREWRRDRKDVSVTLLLGALNFVYVSLALFGLWRLLHVRGISDSGVLWAALFLVAFALIRTAFLTQMETPEPRYVLECFPAVLALGAMVWLPSKG